jgi:hypothetical protein
MSKRKLPDSIVETAVTAAAGVNHCPPTKQASVDVPDIDLVATPPRRIIPKGSPAHDFVQRSPTSSVETVSSRISAM